MGMTGFIIKGLIRDRSRSLFPFLTVAIGVALVVFLDAYLRGTQDSVFDTTARLVTGHLMVTTRAQAQEGESGTLETALFGVKGLKAELKGKYSDIIWTERIRFSGLIDVPDSLGMTRAQVPVTGLAVDLTPGSVEHQLLQLQKALVRGRVPQESREILLSEDLCQRLGISPGARVSLISMTAEGGMAIADFTLAGTVRFGVTALDRSMVIGKLEGVQEVLGLEDGASEIVGFFADGVYDDRRAVQIAREYNTGLTGIEDEFAPIMRSLREASDLGSLIDIVAGATGLIVLIFIMAMAVVLWNAGLMGSLRRYGEIGIRLALGESKPALYFSLLAEAFFIGLVGSVAGTLIGLVPAYYLQKIGLNIGGMMKNTTVVISEVLRARITPTSFFVGFLPGLIATFLGSAISGLGIFRRSTARLAKEFSE
ncbi:FtsX-like permease family protein [candidate division WOR-3 bacterium]|nr:FtsX-like permease family protein [candidate division WOR-3 bacterium]